MPTPFDALNRLSNGQGMTPMVLGSDRRQASTIANSGTVDTRDAVVLLTTGGAVTGAIMRAGEHFGQMVIVVNQSANTITMAAEGTSLVRDGVTSVIKANGAALFIWDGSRWNSVI